MKLLRGKLSWQGRVLYLLAGACLIGSLFFPLWHMNLEAPQYPEGLAMKVYLEEIGGRIDIINNLNHYIGMKEISEADFPELQYMPKIAIGLAVLALITALAKKAWLGSLNLLLLTIGGGLGLSDLWYWLHKYGVELDPNAPMKIDPFVPPMIGSNVIANFTTHTGFDIGGYLLGLSIAFMGIALWRFNICDKKEADVNPSIKG